MFESADPAECIDTMGVAARAESAAIAERLEAVWRLYSLRMAAEDPATRLWCIDGFEGVSAEVSAAQNISRSRAASQVRTAVSLYQRLPAVAAVFAKGDIDFRLVRMIINRTDNVEDDIIADLDAALASRVGKWMRLSTPKLQDRLDLWVADFDAAAVRVPPAVKDNCYFDVDPHPQAPGMASVGGVLEALDAAALNQRLDAIAATVCKNDPRTAAQRRAAAGGALGRLEAGLVCQCDNQDCPTRAERAAAAQVVIHVLAEQATLDGTSDHPGYVPGLGVLPAESVREAAKTANVTPVRRPSAEPETGYRPATGLADFLRWRDLTCRWPGCDTPVQRCDLDHTAPWPAGPTHASNLKHYCRTHHLIKTFAVGWADQQLPDGTVSVTAPTGHVYTTKAHGATLFSGLATPTGTVDAAPPEPSPDRSAMMPRRKQAREQDRRDRVNRERLLRVEINAEVERQHQAWLTATYEPPPF